MKNNIIHITNNEPTQSSTIKKKWEMLDTAYSTQKENNNLSTKPGANNEAVKSLSQHTDTKATDNLLLEIVSQNQKKHFQARAKKTRNGRKSWRKGLDINTTYQKNPSNNQTDIADRNSRPLDGQNFSGNDKNHSTNYLYLGNKAVRRKPSHIFATKTPPYMTGQYANMHTGKLFIPEAHKQSMAEDYSQRLPEAGSKRLLSSQFNQQNKPISVLEPAAKKPKVNLLSSSSSSAFHKPLTRSNQTLNVDRATNKHSMARNLSTSESGNILSNHVATNSLIDNSNLSYPSNSFNQQNKPIGALEPTFKNPKVNLLSSSSSSAFHKPLTRSNPTKNVDRATNKHSMARNLSTSESGNIFSDHVATNSLIDNFNLSYPSSSNQPEDDYTLITGHPEHDNMYRHKPK